MDLQYIKHKAVASVIRFLAPRGMGPIVPTPDEKLQLPSRDPNRTIQAHIYRSKSKSNATNPSPILLNFHGSGFIIPLHGSDDEFAHYIAKNTPYTVLDVAYRLAPENPFPAALNDVEDAVNWVLSQPTEFDTSHIAISGFSAGGNLALVAGSSGLFPPNTFRHLIAFYPPTDLGRDPSTKIAPDTSGRPIPAWMASIFDDSYLPAGVDRKGPKVSPFYTPAESFPDNVLLITCARDGLCLEAEAVAEKIEQVEGKRAVLRRMEGCDHAWDKSCKPGSEGERAKDEAYELVARTLGG